MSSLTAVVNTKEDTDYKLLGSSNGGEVPRQECPLSICEHWLSWTNTEAKIQIALLLLNGDPVKYIPVTVNE